MASTAMTGAFVASGPEYGSRLTVSLLRSVVYHFAVAVGAAGRANGMGKSAFAALAEHHVGNIHPMVGTAHAFSGFGFFVLLNSHDLLLAIRL
jgi:hypothetical protein